MRNIFASGSSSAIGLWLLQRITAFCMVLYTFVAIYRVLCMSSWDYRDWYGLFSPLWFRALTFVVFGALCLHAWIGMRDIIMDYVKPFFLRLALYVIVVFFLCFYMFWAFEILQGAC